MFLLFNLTSYVLVRTSLTCSVLHLDCETVSASSTPQKKCKTNTSETSTETLSVAATQQTHKNETGTFYLSSFQKFFHSCVFTI